MTTAQRMAIPAAIDTAERFAAANGLVADLVTYAEIREMAETMGDHPTYGVYLFTTDPANYEVTVRVEIMADGTIHGPVGLDRVDVS